MTITRTEHGGASSKASGATLTSGSFTVPQGHSLTVGVMCENSQLAPDTVTHAGRTLRNKEGENNTTQGYHTSAWLKAEYHRDQTGVVVATWGSAINERVLVATSYDLAQTEDKSAGRSETTTTTSPLSGATTALDSNVALAVCYFGSNGPVEDHGSATADIQDGGSWTAATIGQQVGTDGGGAASNVAIVETYLQLTSTTLTRGRLQSATSRRWANVILVMKPRPTWYTQGITPTDIGAVEDLVDGAGGDTDDVLYGFDEDTGHWMAYEGANTWERGDDGVWA